MKRTGLLQWALLMSVLFLVVGARRTYTPTFTVNSVVDASDVFIGDGVCMDDEGLCTLRAAIQEVNALGMSQNTISFAMLGDGLHTITVFENLPPITQPVIIDGLSQSGSSCGNLWAGDPPVLKVIIQGDRNFPHNLDYGLVLSGGNSIVRGLIIKGFFDGPMEGVSQKPAIRVDTHGDNIVECNVLVENGNGVTVHTERNTIGGIGKGNVLSGNISHGVLIDSPGAHHNLIMGNFIGTNETGDTAYPNNRGVAIEQGDDNTIGGLAVGAGNLIAGNAAYQQYIAGPVLQIYVALGVSRTIIQQNYFGVDRTGTVALYTGEDRVTKEIIIDGADTLIGGDTERARNIIVPLHTGINNSDEATDTIITGNYIGLNATGSAAIAPALLDNSDGIHDNGTRTIITRNVISGFYNDSGDCGLESHAMDSVVEDNLFGTDPSGLLTEGFANAIGVIFFMRPGNTLRRNVIGNSEIGVVILGSKNTISGNYIGVARNGITPLPNALYGVVFLSPETQNNTVGGIKRGTENIIAYSGGAGIALYHESFAEIGVSGTGNAFLRNTFHHNAGLDIAFGDPFVATPNDELDSDTGPNDLQNHPILTGIEARKGGARLEGELRSAPRRRYRLEFFVDGAFVRAKRVRTDENGIALFTAQIRNAPLGATIRSTASLIMQNKAYATSEFSEGIVVP